MTGEIAAHGMRVGPGHAHLPDAVQQRHAPGDQGGTNTIMKVQEIVIRSAAFFDLQPETGIECFLAWPADPEESFPGLAHFDHPLFHGAGTDHDAVDLETAA